MQATLFTNAFCHRMLQCCSMVNFQSWKTEIEAFFGNYRSKSYRKTKKHRFDPVLAFLVIYHKIRDFELDPRDKNFCSVTSHETLKVRDFGKFPKKLGKSSNFAQKVIISVTKNQK